MGRWIAEQAGGVVAERFIEEIIAYCERLDLFPERGVARNDLRPGLRTISFRGRVTIAYRVKDRTVTILAVFYAGQDFETLLREI